MRYSTVSLGVVAVLASNVVAFPAGMMEELAAKGKRCPYADLDNSKLKEKRVLGVAPGFNAAQQHISTTGDHAFVAPNFSAGDIRGPCPGLNALANHGYLPHNGVITLAQGVQATNQVFGMGLDLGTFLSTYATVTDGNPLTGTWSIGGAPPVPAGSTLGGLLTAPQGLDGSHNKYETDSSPCRGDYYQYNGNNYAVQLDNFKKLYALQQNAASPNYDLNVLLQHRKTRFQDSINQNPDFFYGPFSGIAVSQAAFTFIYRFMSNKSAEAPEGILNKDVLKSFFGITGDDNNLAVVPGGEKIPDNWYKRAIGDEYTIPSFEMDLLSYATQYPQILSVGGNTGTTNSFTGVDISDLTGGVYNSKNLLTGNNLLCFTFQAAALGEPDILKGELADTQTAVNTISKAVGVATSALGCPQLQSIDASQFKKYPGYTKSPYYKK